MLVQPGGIYRLNLSIYDAQGLGPAWIVGALGATYPLAEVFALEAYSDQAASVLIRWTRRPGNIDEGTTLSAIVEGIQVTGSRIPVAKVEGVALVSRSAEPPPPLHTVARLVTAVVLIGATALLCSRIKAGRGNASSTK
jgi:hypothetical protein